MIAQCVRYSKDERGSAFTIALACDLSVTAYHAVSKLPGVVMFRTHASHDNFQKLVDLEVELDSTVDLHETIAAALAMLALAD